MTESPETESETLDVIKSRVWLARHAKFRGASAKNIDFCRGVACAAQQFDGFDGFDSVFDVFDRGAEPPRGEI